MFATCAQIGIAVLSLASAENAASPASLPEWTFNRYSQLVEQTGRGMELTRREFDLVQRRKPAAVAQVEAFLIERLGNADANVVAAFRAVPRELFHYDYEKRASSAALAYESLSHPWPIGYGATLSEYCLQAYMTQLAKPDAGDVALEIGTGSGFQAAFLSRIVKQVYTIEIVEPLGTAVKDVLAKSGFDNVHVRVGDGFYGWPEVEGGFDVIIVTCAARYVPPALLAQLKPNGRLIIPVGPPSRGGQVLYVYTKDETGKVRSSRDLGVIFVPMVGAIDRQSATDKQE